MWWTPAPDAPGGTRTGADQRPPSGDEAITSSFGVADRGPQPARKRQSGQVTNTRPAASISADGSGAARNPGGSLASTSATTTAAAKLAPPSVERTARIEEPPRYGTTSTPSGRTSGCPPLPCAASKVAGGLHVRPPSVDTDTPMAESRSSSAQSV